jgi:hypothetical protein
MKRAKGTLPAALVAAFAIAASSGHSGPAEAAQIISSSVCDSNISYCIRLLEDDPGTTFVVFNYTFTAPRAGTALVSFNASMQCINADTTSGDTGVIDLTTQILTSEAATPNHQAAGGTRFAMRLPPANRALPGPPNGIDRSDPIELASSRVVPLTRGSHELFFKILRNRMDSGTSCTLWNGNFDVVFVP